MTTILDLLKQANAITTDSHIIYTSGKHGDAYINKDALYPHTAMASQVGKMMAEKYKDTEIDVVVAPALGGIILSQWVAHHLSVLVKKEILGVYAEKDADKNLIFTRGYDKLVAGKKVLVVEDVTNTGGSAKKVVDSVKEIGGTVVGVCVMVNRNPKVDEAYMGAPFTALAEFPTIIYDEADCPMCKENVPVNTEIGHGRKYVMKKESSS